MINLAREKIGFNWLFCFTSILLFAIIYLIKPELGLRSWQYFTNLIFKILPVLLFVFVLLFISHLLIQPKHITKYLGHKLSLISWLIAIIGGIISSGPIYMWYPMLADLKEKGMKNSLIVTFIYARAIKIPLMPMLIYYFGWLYVLILTIYLIIFSVINGLIVDKLLHKHSSNTALAPTQKQA